MEHQDQIRKNCDTTDVSDVLRRLETYEELSAQHVRYGSLLENAITHRSSVREHIFHKVKEEYAEKKFSLEQSRKSLEDLLLGHLTAFVRERDHLDVAGREAEDRLAEIDFRVRVGEYAEEGTAEERNALRQSLERHIQDLERMEQVLKAYSRAGLSSPAGPSSGPPEAGPKGTGSGEPSLSSPGADPSAETDWTARETISLDQDPAKSQVTEPETRKDPETVGEFQVLEQDTDLCDEDCPVVQFLDGTCEALLPEQSDPGEKSGGNSPGSTSSGCVSGYLVAMGGSRLGERFPLLCSNITLGSSPGCDIRLNDPGIKNFHAQIHFKGRKHYLENLDSMGCSFVNGSLGSQMELKDGDIIRLAEVKFQVEYSEANESIGQGTRPFSGS
jgi:hypothetical protein